jgi:hypothetical protein
MLHMERVEIAGRGFGKGANVLDEYALEQREPLPRKLKPLDPDVLALVRERNTTLRQGLPGDGTPKTAKEARARCPHREIQHLAIGLPSAPWTMTYIPRAVPVQYPDGHVCIGGWLL